MLATSCQVYPSEYAYQDDSITTSESASANCRNYPPGNLQSGDHPEHFIHCDGTQLKLADSIFGQGEYQTSDYYAWNVAKKDGELLFIFPSRVSLTSITLHYYSDNFRGLPRLRFYAVQDDYDVWDAITNGTPYEDIEAVQPGGEPAGRRNVSISFNFNTKKVLMYKYINNIMYAMRVSEVEFFCSSTSSKLAVLNLSSRQ